MPPGIVLPTEYEGFPGSAPPYETLAGIDEPIMPPERGTVGPSRPRFVMYDDDAAGTPVSTTAGTIVVVSIIVGCGTIWTVSTIVGCGAGVSGGTVISGSCSMLTCVSVTMGSGARCVERLFFFFLPIPIIPSPAASAELHSPKKQQSAQRATRVQSHQSLLDELSPEDDPDESSVVVTTVGGGVCAAWVVAAVVFSVGGGVIVVSAGRSLSTKGRRAMARGNQFFFVVVGGSVELHGVVVDGTVENGTVDTGTSSTQQVAKSPLLHTSPAQKCWPSFAE